MEYEREVSRKGAQKTTRKSMVLPSRGESVRVAKCLTYLLNKCFFFFRNIQNQSLTSETYFRLGLGVLHVYIVQDQTLGRFGRS